MEDPWRAERHFWAHGVCTTRRRGRAEGGSGGAAWERRSRADGWRIDKAMASGWCGEARSASRRVDETGRGETGQTGRRADGQMDGNDEARWRGQRAVGRQRHGCGWLMEAATAITGGDYCSKLLAPPGRGLRGDLPMSQSCPHRRISLDDHCQRRAGSRGSGQCGAGRPVRKYLPTQLPRCPGTQVPTVAAHVLALAGSAVLLQVLLSRRFAAAVVVMAVVMVAGVSLSAATCACPSTRSRPAVT
jgi:hypothetical protein